MSNSFVISAECYDNLKQNLIKFDAVEWFEQSDDDAIISLLKRDWAVNSPTDPIVDSFTETDAEISARIYAMFNYVEATNLLDSGDLSDYMCQIDAEDVIAWIEENRPELHSEILQYFVGQLILNAELHRLDMAQQSTGNYESWYRRMSSTRG